MNCANICALPDFRALVWGARTLRGARRERSSPSARSGMTEEKKPFSVTDRRHFTPEGEVRQEEESARAPASTPPERLDAEPGPPHEDGERSQYPKDLPGLLISLGAQASLLLYGDPAVGGPDLEGARDLISLLEVLKEKTQGHRTPQEDQLLDGLLYELRMAYVQRSGKAAGP